MPLPLPRDCIQCHMERWDFSAYRNKENKTCDKCLDSSRRSRLRYTKEQLYGYHKAWRDSTQLGRNSIKRQNTRRRLQLYGLTEESYQEILIKQNNAWAKCKKTFTKKIHTDHDHVTDQVRGLLCHSCNLGLGLLGDTLESLQEAVDYLKQAKQRTYLPTSDKVFWAYQ